MTADEVLETLSITSWDGPVPSRLQHRAIEALEAGRVLTLPALRFTVADTEHSLLCRDSLGSRSKNVSLEPSHCTLRHSALPPAETRALAAMMRRFAAAALHLVSNLLPSYAASVQPGRTSFRPAEIADRSYSPRHDDRLLHVDAFPTRPQGSRRILRVFSNIAPDGAPRLWAVGEPFPVFADAFLPRLKPPLPGSARVLQVLRLTKGGRSTYDHLMLGLHDAIKLDRAFQASTARVELAFAAGTT